MPHRQRRKLLKPVNLQYETGTSGLLLQNMPDDSIFTGMGERRISAIDNLLAAYFGNSGTFDYIATSYDGYDEIILGNTDED